MELIDNFAVPCTPYIFHINPALRAPQTQKLSLHVQLMAALTVFQIDTTPVQFTRSWISSKTQRIYVRSVLENKIAH